MCALTCVWIYEHLFVHACRGQRSTLAISPTFTHSFLYFFFLPLLCLQFLTRPWSSTIKLHFQPPNPGNSPNSQNLDYNYAPGLLWGSNRSNSGPHAWVSIILGLSHFLNPLFKFVYSLDWHIFAICIDLWYIWWCFDPCAHWVMIYIE